MKKKAPLSAIQFNALAIVTLLGFMPFAIAFITSAGSDSDGTYESSISGNTPGNKGIWYSNGENFTAIYEDMTAGQGLPPGWYDCAYIVAGDCQGGYSETLLNLGAGYSVQSNDEYVFGQNQRRQFAPGEYPGTSGTGEFGFYVYGQSFNLIEQNATLDKIKYTFYDADTEYVCDYSGFVELEIEASVTFIYENKSLEYSAAKFSTDNKYEFIKYYQDGSWANVCVNGFSLEFDFTGFESIGLSDFNDGDWASTDHLIEMQSITRKDGFNIANTLIPFNGDEFFTFKAEHQEIDPVQAGFIIQSLTALLSVGTFLLALGSTEYWSPVTNFFKGRV